MECELCKAVFIATLTVSLRLSDCFDALGHLSSKLKDKRDTMNLMNMSAFMVLIVFIYGLFLRLRLTQTLFY